MPTRVLPVLAAPMLTLALTLALALPAHATVSEKTGRFGGQQVTYKIVTPPGYDAARSYPTVLVFGGGPQDRRVVEGTVETDWRAEAEKRGYVVIAPMAPAAGLFFEGGDKAFPDFLTMIQRDYHVAPGKLVVAGHSNGGLSAYHIAGLYPAAFKVVIGYPGLFGEDADLARAPKLKGACMFMHVGELDNGWKGGMKAEADFLKRQGYRIAFAVEPKQTHRIKAGEVNLSARLFNEIESCK